MASSLIGPPEIAAAPDNAPSTAVASDPFMDLLSAKFSEASSISVSPPMGLTENLSATYLSTGSPCLDFFFHVVPDTDPESINERLQLAWAHDPLTTLKLICNLRGVRGTGKSDKTGFYTAALWLHANHPKTLACNLPSFAEFGYFKDMLEILFQILGLTHPRKMWRQKNYRFRGRRRPVSRPMRNKGEVKAPKPPKDDIADGPVKPTPILQSKEKQEAVKARHQKKAEMAKKALQRYTHDPNYRFLHDRVSDLFAAFLNSDIESLKSGKKDCISLAAKWCPSLDLCFDRATLLCEAIARKVFPKDSNPEYANTEEAHYAYRVRDRLRKEVLAPLRKALEIPEVYMSAQRWHELPYNRVASVAMKTYKELFEKHDQERFNEYLENVKSGKAKIAAGALLPHEIIAALKDGGDVPDLQWNRMVDDMKKEGKLSNCLPVCDVSGSMAGIPMEVCVALGLLLSELAEEPWKGHVITFSEKPQLHLIRGNDLRSKTDFIREMEWNMNTDFQKVFDEILKVAVGGKLSPDQMIKRMFVFSDMEFDQASTRPWETDYQVITRKFTEQGYGDAIPEIVFWNLRDSTSTPVVMNQRGVALVSGFSKNLMKLFLDGKQDQLTPVAVMEAAISGVEYSNLVVLD